MMQITTQYIYTYRGEPKRIAIYYHDGAVTTDRGGDYVYTEGELAGTGPLTDAQREAIAGILAVHLVPVIP